MPRKEPLVPDATVFAAVIDVISAEGPTGLTLARVGERAGLTAGALVIRFGSKRGMLAAFAARSVADVHRLFEEAARRTPDDPWAAAVDGLVRLATPVGDRRSFANHLGWFAQELADEDLRQHAVAHARLVQAELARLLGGPVPARRLYTAYQGALILWALGSRGTLSAYLRRELSTPSWGLDLR